MRMLPSTGEEHVPGSTADLPSNPASASGWLGDLRQGAYSLKSWFHCGESKDVEDSGFSLL